MVAVVTMVDAVLVFASLIAERHCWECRPRLGFRARKYRSGLFDIMGRGLQLRTAGMGLLGHRSCSQDEQYGQCYHRGL